LGPTASGKTALAFELKERLGDQVDLISVDSVLVYRGLNIGSAKPSDEEQARYPHALIDIRDPSQPYSASEFVCDASRLILSAQQAGRLPVLIGGTMLYFKALFQGLDPLPPSDPHIRGHLTDQLALKGVEAMHAKLALIDPVSAAKLKSTDTQRILRALEVFEMTARPLSDLQSGKTLKMGNLWTTTALTPDRAWLHERIEVRLEVMWQMGLLDEVKGLLALYPDHDRHTWSKAVGYRQVIEALEANPDLVMEPDQTLSSASDSAVINLKQKTLFATRQLAKRQYTWIRRFERDLGVRCYHKTTALMNEIKKSHSV
jgi:tRNA dimethylallyltransferase